MLPGTKQSPTELGREKEGAHIWIFWRCPAKLGTDECAVCSNVPSKANGIEAGTPENIQPDLFRFGLSEALRDPQRVSMLMHVDSDDDEELGELEREKKARGKLLGIFKEGPVGAWPWSSLQLRR